MANKYTRAGQMEQSNAAKQQAAQRASQVPSLLDVMRDGEEYKSICGNNPRDLAADVLRSLGEIEAARGRPCLCYVGNVFKTWPDTSILHADHLPFSEMVNRVAPSVKEVDVLICTAGGQSNTVRQFVETLRSRFSRVEFIIPYMAMSAGTLWALSGERIWMTPDAFIGPIDPQVPTKNGRLVPAQAVLVLMDDLQRQVAEAQAKKQPIPWQVTAVLANLDLKEVGDALSSKQYMVRAAAEYLEKYKFREWTRRASTGQDVTPDYRRARALAVAEKLASHERWNAHGHAIRRDAAAADLELQIDHPETVDGFARALRRFWALMTWALENSATCKVFQSTNYTLIRSVPISTAQGARQ